LEIDGEIFDGIGGMGMMDYMNMDNGGNGKIQLVDEMIESMGVSLLPYMVYWDICYNGGYEPYPSLKSDHNKPLYVMMVMITILEMIEGVRRTID
jgi:hypothetical protein